MVDILEHRGPDGKGVWSEGPAGLGHRMLWTTPESKRERLPLSDKTGDLVLTADARIDNRQELLALLDFARRPGQEVTDSEIILSAYEKWGERCPERLLGDFAFAVWDRRRQVLFCARDHLGVKPFFYYHSGQTVIFGSEIKALLCLAEVPRRLNEVKVADYLSDVLQDKAITFYKGILRLPPGHCLTASRKGVSLREYWSLDPSRELRLGSDDEYDEAFREVFTEAVRCRVRSVLPLGSTLSGGLDSSSITCVARQLLQQNGNHPLQTFSAVFDEVRECDERPYIDAILAQGGLESHYVYPEQTGPMGDLERVFWHADEPPYAPNLYILWSLYRAAGHRGVRVLLDGVLGDQAVSHGTAYLAELAREGQWKAFADASHRLSEYFQSPPLRYLEHYGTAQLARLARRGRWLALADQSRQISKHFDVSPRKLILRHGIWPLAPKAVRSSWRALKMRARQREPWASIVKPEFARRVGLKERFQVLEGERLKPAGSEREHHFRSLTSGAYSYGLEVLDMAAAAFTVEPRHPFVDRRLVEFCLALPPEQKLANGWSRFVLRRAMAGILPDEVRWRERHSNLSGSFTHTLLTLERQRLDETILNDPSTIEEYVDLTTLREKYRRFLPDGRPGPAVTVWKAANLALWLEHADIRP